MAQNVNKKAGPDPEYLSRHKASLLHNKRQVVTFNEQEMAAIDLYIKKFKICSKTAFFRKAIMQKVLMELEENAPTLF